MSWGDYIPSDFIDKIDYIRSTDIHDGMFRYAKNEIPKLSQLRYRYTDIPPRDDLIWYAVDLDGTLAEGIWTPDSPVSRIGDPIWENVDKLREVEAAGFKIVIHTARGWTDYQNIEGWLNHYNIPYRHIVCGKLLAFRYVDDRAISADEESWLPKREGGHGSDSA